MLAGVFLRYVMVEITDFLDLDPVNFFWVEEVGEFSLTWLTMIGAAIGILSFAPRCCGAASSCPRARRLR